MSENQAPAGIEEIRVAQSSTGSSLWEPFRGPEIDALLERQLGGQANARNREVVLEEARRILSRCARPTAPDGQTTGLVMGYIQSGKTLSFTAVAALARDNAYRMVIVIAGTTNNLAEQSRDRLIRDLGLGETSFPKWQHFHNPDSGDVPRIRDVLSEWNDANVPENERRSVFVTVLKYHSQLRKLVRVLSSLGHLRGVP